MSWNAEDIQKRFLEEFDPKAYWEDCNRFGEGEFDEESAFLTQKWHDMFRSAEIRGSTALDIGCGPIVHIAAAVCHYFEEIVLSDYLDVNIAAVKKWLRNEQDAFDWSRVLRRAAQAHGYEDPEKGREVMEKLLRDRIKAVIHCDLLKDSVLPEEFEKPYDLVITSLCLEATAPDFATYKKCLKKINRLTKLNGHLAIKGFTGGGPWKAGETEFPCLKLSREGIQNALQEAGFEDIKWWSIQKKDKNYYFQFDEAFVLCCIKLNECGSV